MPRRAKTRDYQNLECVHQQYIQQNGDDDSSSGAIRNFAIGHSQMQK